MKTQKTMVALAALAAVGMASCASRPAVKEYLGPALDRPYTMPEGSDRISVSGGVGLYSGGLSYLTASPAVWTSAPTSNVNLRVGAFELGIDGQVVKTSNHRLGFSLGVRPMIIAGFGPLVAAVASGSYRWIGGSVFGWDVTPYFGLLSNFAGLNGGVLGLDTGPVFQIGRYVSTKLKVGAATGGTLRAGASASVLLPGDVELSASYGITHQAAQTVAGAVSFYW